MLELLVKDKLITTKEALKELGNISTSTLYRLSKEKKVKKINLSQRTIRYSYNSIIAHINASIQIG